MEDKKNKKQNILVVDDSSVIHKIVSGFLKDEPYELLFAFDGKEGLKLVESNQIDLILSDVNMPIMNGFEMCKKLKESEHKKIPLVFLTAEQTDSDFTFGHEIGGCDYLPKPFKKDELLFRITNQIRIKTFQETIRKDEKRHQHFAMIATLGHELNNAVTILAGGISKLKSKKAYDEAAIDKITKSASHIADVVKKLKNLDPDSLSYQEYAEGVDMISLEE